MLGVYHHILTAIARSGHQNQRASANREGILFSVDLLGSEPIPVKLDMERIVIFDFHWFPREWFIELDEKIWSIGADVYECVQIQIRIRI